MYLRRTKKTSQMYYKINRRNAMNKEIIDIVMPTYNGEKYLKEQIDSILNQSYKDIRLIISDDGSKDSTVQILKEYEEKEKRVKIYVQPQNLGVVRNIEFLLRKVESPLFMLADQDDVWLPNKIKELSDFLIQGNYDVVTGNCALTDSNLNIIQEKYYTDKSPLDKTVWGNFVKDLWLGSCMAFTREVLMATLPFPKRMAAHDLWIALYSQLHFNCGYYPKVLQLYRRHDATVSFAGSKSTNKLSYKVSYRLYLAYWLIVRSLMKHR